MCVCQSLLTFFHFVQQQFIDHVSPIDMCTHRFHQPCEMSFFPFSFLIPDGCPWCLLSFFFLPRNEPNRQFLFKILSRHWTGACHLTLWQICVPLDVFFPDIWYCPCSIWNWDHIDSMPGLYISSFSLSLSLSLCVCYVHHLTGSRPPF